MLLEKEMEITWSFLKFLGSKDATSALCDPNQRFGLFHINYKSGSHSNLRYWGFKIELIWPFCISFDLDIVAYAVGSNRVRHQDLHRRDKGWQHRMSLLLWKATDGGQLLADSFVLDLPRLKIFNSRTPHEVTRINSGRRIVILAGLFLRIGSSLELKL